MQPFVAYATKGCPGLFARGNVVAANPFLPFAHDLGRNAWRCLHYRTFSSRQAFHASLGLDVAIPLGLSGFPRRGRSSQHSN
jgi:hypothetical protein